MGFLDNLFKNTDYNQFGISNAQAKEIDLLDGKDDNKINGKSIFDAIKEARESYDTSENQGMLFFDYLKNIYKKTSVMFDLTSGKSNFIRIFGFGNYPAEDVVKEILDEIYKLGKANLDEPINKITSENVVEVLQLYKTKSDEKNTLLGLKLDDESLFEAILDESISKEKKKEYITHIKNMLIEKVDKLNGNAEFIGSTFDKILDKVLESSWGLQDATKLNQLFDAFLTVIDRLDNLNKMNSVNKNSTLNVSLQSLYDFCRANGIDTTDLLGNGKFDGNAYQMTGNCILHANLNAMLVTDKGRQYLDNLVVKNNDFEGNGNITVFLPGALKLGIPKENPGYFTYSPIDLMNRAMETSLGEGDYTAIACAIEDCRKLATGNENVSSAENACGISIESLLFAQEPERYFPENDSTTALRTKLERKKKLLQANVSLKEHPEYKKIEAEVKDYEDNLNMIVNYENLKEKFDSGNVAITAGIAYGDTIKGICDGKEITLMDDHRYAVIAMSDSTVTLRESNNPESLITVSKEEYVKMTTRVIEIYLNGNIPDTNEGLKS